MVTINKFIDRINGQIPNLSVNLDEHSKKFVRCIVGDFGLNAAELKYIENAFTKAGWSSISFLTSAENGERPGLIEIILYLREN